MPEGAACPNFQHARRCSMPEGAACLKVQHARRYNMVEGTACLKVQCARRQRVCTACLKVRRDSCCVQVQVFFRTLFASVVVAVTCFLRVRVPSCVCYTTSTTTLAQMRSFWTGSIPTMVLRLARVGSLLALGERVVHTPTATATGHFYTTHPITSFRRASGRHISEWVGAVLVALARSPPVAGSPLLRPLVSYLPCVRQRSACVGGSGGLLQTSPLRERFPLFSGRCCAGTLPEGSRRIAERALVGPGLVVGLKNV